MTDRINQQSETNQEVTETLAVLEELAVPEGNTAERGTVVSEEHEQASDSSLLSRCMLPARNLVATLLLGTAPGCSMSALVEEEADMGPLQPAVATAPVNPGVRTGSFEDMFDRASAPAPFPKQPLKKEPDWDGERELDINFTDSDGQLVDDTYAPWKLKSRNVDRDIYLTKGLKSKFAAGFPPNESFAKETFFIDPDLTLDVNKLEEAFDSKKQIGTLHGEPIYVMHINADLLPEEVRAEAADEINRRFPSANVTKDNIAVRPYKYIEFTADIDGKRTLVGSWPKISLEKGEISALGGRPVSLPISFTGTEATLRHIKDFANIEADFYASGFKIKQNIFSVCLNNLVKMGFDQYLTGNADYQNLQHHKAETGLGGINLPFFGGSKSETEGISIQTQKSAVTRTQVIEVVKALLQTVNISEWKEFEGNPERQKELQNILVNRLLSRMDEIEIELDKDWNLVIGENIKPDIAPDVLTKLQHDVKNHKDLDIDFHGKFSKGVSAGGDKDDKKSSGSKGGGGLAVDVENNMQTVTDDDMNYSSDSTTVIPKSITVYQANASDFEDLFSLNTSEIEASRECKAFKIRGMFVEIIIHPDVVLETNLEQEVFIETLDVKQGDGEIDSDDDKTTKSSIFTRNLTVSEDGTQLTLDYEVNDREGGGDQTWLQKTGTVAFNLPADKVLLEYGQGKEHANVDFPVTGEFHAEIRAIPPGEIHEPYTHPADYSIIDGTYIKKAEWFVDGDGDDQYGNAQFRLRFSIPVKLLVEEGWVEVVPRHR